MNTPSRQTNRMIIESSIDLAMGRKERLRTEAEKRLEALYSGESVEAAELLPLIRILLDIQRAQDSIAADRYNLTSF